MKLFVWLALCFLLALISFALLFFRRRLTSWLSAHPRFSRVAALILAIIMIVCSAIPIVIIGFYSQG